MYEAISYNCRDYDDDYDDDDDDDDDDLSEKNACRSDNDDTNDQYMVVTHAD